MEFREKKYTVEFSNNLNTMEISQSDDDNEVQMDISGFRCSVGFILTQENIKQLIDHLQKQLK